MANEKNLIPFSERTKEEARESGRKGGKASGAARRRKKSLRESAKLFLELKTSDEQVREALSADGVHKADQTNQMAIIAGLTHMAIMGDHKAAKVLFDLIPLDAEDAEGGVQIIDDL